jgi:parallel beta-helix repeat protein
MNKWVTPVAVLFFALLFVTAPCIAFQPVKATSGNIVVPDDYATIQSALDTVQNGDRIYVKTGIYHENLNITKSVSLIGESKDSTVIDGNSSQGYRAPIRIYSNNVTVTGFKIEDSWTGILIGHVNDCKISGNIFTNNHDGIVLSSASRNVLEANVIERVKTNGYGIQLWDSTNNILKKNQIYSASIGIAIRGQPSNSFGENNWVLANILSDCAEQTIMIGSSSNNILMANTVSNSGRGISLFETDNNTIHHNNFLSNSKQVTDSSPEPAANGGIHYSISQWEDGKEGNYWSNYVGADANLDGIGDTPYSVNEKNTDHYPLMNPVSEQEMTRTINKEIQFPSATPSPSPSPTTLEPKSTDTSSNPEPFPNGQAIAITASATVATVGLFVFFKKYSSYTEGGNP